MLLPPDNFGLVEEGIYRCSKLDPINFTFLETLELKKVIILNNETSLMNKFQSFIKYNNITPIKFDNIDTEIGTETDTNDWMVFPQNIIQEVLEVLLMKENYNLLIIDKTNVIVGLIRKICKWSYSSLISEYRLYSGKNANYFAETFLELATIRMKPRYLTDIEDSRRASIDAGLYDRSADETEIPDDFDENEENLLSASPQVPKTLLKMAEKRKQKNKANESTSLLDMFTLLKTGETSFYLPEPEFQSIQSIKINLPLEKDLPDWFKLQRDMWVQELHTQT